MPELKAYTRYVCPVGAGTIGHSSLYTGGQSGASRPNEDHCMCGAEYVEEKSLQDGKRYRLTFESVDPFQASAMVQTHGKDVWPRLTPAEWDALSWHEVTREADSPVDIKAQHEQLTAWAASHEQPIRNVQLLVAREPEWEPAT